MAQIIKATGERIKVKPKNGTDFQLDELKDFVGGYIEIVRLKAGKILVVNEDGMIYNLPFNYEATELAYRMIFGDVLYCDINQVK